MSTHHKALSSHKPPINAILASFVKVQVLDYQMDIDMWLDFDDSFDDEILDETEDELV